MRAVLQRVSEASVTVDDTITGAIKQGLLVLFCAEHGDHDDEAAYFARKISKMRIFTDDDGKMNRSVLDIGGSVLAVSQFTLAANWKKGNRPGFSGAAAPVEGERLYEFFCNALKSEGLTVEKGVFGAHMDVRLLNDGPVTIVMDSKDSA
ncbi:D-tyrosyl-tRNA(Tyr) deacylase [Kiloniella litopenaei]|uniref:D-aminoacyl-tRNA deacylase n=1 Tax=Kiloniella litopenaei TaxID=1549748 RepID=A0A0M2R681_9PROT|nr:D-aminoacyl-tRNA deacylase [Kiloniella litopenaei]KKJ75949.1 D-tyrosyl-tRNA(Tyr) deacylase [Kiloniella litopenaei]